MTDADVDTTMESPATSYEDDPENCVQLVNLPASSSQTASSIQWNLRSATDGDIITTGTTQPNQTTSTACWGKQPQQKPAFECAVLELLRFNDDDDPWGGRIMTVAWKGSVWHSRFIAYYPDYDNRERVIWLGDKCHEHQRLVCGGGRNSDTINIKANGDTWLLDYELTTSDYNYTNGVVHWQINNEYQNVHRGSIFNPPSLTWPSDTRNRWLLCAQRDLEGCTTLGLANTSNSMVSNLTIRVDGDVKTNNTGWVCNHRYCSQKIVTPLWGPCSSSTGPKAGGGGSQIVASMAIAAAVLTTLLY